jgi:hypothetical protein
MREGGDHCIAPSRHRRIYESGAANQAFFMNLEGLKNWKLKLRYGRMKTAFRHFTVLAEGDVVSPNEDFETGLGPSIFGMKVWASD